MQHPVSPKDQENLVQASHTAGLLSDSLRELAKSEDPLFAELCLELIIPANKLRLKLERLSSLAEVKE